MAKIDTPFMTKTTNKHTLNLRKEQKISMNLRLALYSFTEMNQILNFLIRVELQSLLILKKD